MTDLISKKVASARRAFRMERKETERGILWMVVDRKTGGGNGIHGDEAAGKDHFEKRVLLNEIRRARLDLQEAERICQQEIAGG